MSHGERGAGRPGPRRAPTAKAWGIAGGAAAAVATIGVAALLASHSGPSPSAPATGTEDACHAGTVTYCVLNPAVTQATIESTICVSGWTKTVRPPESYTDKLKAQQIADQGLPGGPADYEEDHRMPLELGGAPSDPLNLSPESPASPNSKDGDETKLKKEVCAGQVSLVQAQHQLVAMWLAGYPAYRS